MNLNIVDCMLPQELADVKKLLESKGLRYEQKVTHTIGIYNQDQLIATGSLYDNVIKMIAVDDAYQGQNLTDQILTHLIGQLQQFKLTKYFIYTTPQSKKFFSGYPFSLVYENEDIVLLENNVHTIEDQLYALKRELNIESEKIAAIVMNCNPVTLGHLYLIETCSSQNDHVIIFLVEENKSVFPYEVRKDLLSKSILHLDNVHILPSTQYIISSATFPTYFLKEIDDASSIYMTLDISLFKSYFMRIFNIDLRYVGNEPLDPTTNAYNHKMKEILKDKLIVVNRLEKDFVTISASMVRSLARQEKFEELKQFVPKTTYQYLKSKSGRALFNHE